MKKALIISHSVQSAEALSQLLKIEYFTQISIADNSKTAKKLVENDEFDLICINAPLAEESGIELSMYFARVTRSSVVIIVPQKNADDVNDALTEHGGIRPAACSPTGRRCVAADRSGYSAGTDLARDHDVRRRLWPSLA